MHKGLIWEFYGEKFSTIVENLLKTIEKGLKNVENFEKRGDALGQFGKLWDKSPKVINNLSTSFQQCLALRFACS